jgi:putative ABC transport system permease protein
MLEILQNLRRRKLRSGLTISGIVIGIVALTAMGAMAAHFNQLLGSGVQYYGSSIAVGAPTGQQAPLLPLSKMDEIRTVDGVDAVFPAYSFPVKAGGGFSFGGGSELIVNSIPAQQARSLPRTKIAAGRDLTATERGEVVLGTSLANELKKSVGDTINLPVKPADAGSDFVNHTFTVVGILDKTGTAPDGYAYIGESDAQMLLADALPAAIREHMDLGQLAPGFTVYGRPGTSLAELDLIAERINAQVVGVKATKPSVAVNGFKQFVAIFTAITTGAALLALIIGGLSVINTMIMAVSERVREIGLKKALGANSGDIIREYLLEAAMIGLIGGVVGYLLGVGLTTAINAAGRASNLELFLITPTLTFLVIGFAVILGAIAGVLPAIRAARLDPVIALRATN